MVVVKLLDLLETLAVAAAEQWWSVAVIPVVDEDLLVEDVVVKDLDLMLPVVAGLQLVEVLPLYSCK